MARKLLIIDDQTGVTKVIGMIAGELGMDVKGINCSINATEVFVDYRPDVVILDMIMPEKDGIDILNEILVTGIPTQIVLTSGFGDAYLRLANGIARFHDSKPLPVLRKPFRRSDLVELLQDVSNAETMV